MWGCGRCRETAPRALLCLPVRVRKVPAVVDGDDLGHNRQGHLLGRFPAQVQANGAVNTRDLLLAQTLAQQALIALLTDFAAADRADISHLRSTEQRGV